jgi:hypothetical protein
VRRPRWRATCRLRPPRQGETRLTQLVVRHRSSRPALRREGGRPPPPPDGADRSFFQGRIRGNRSALARCRPGSTLTLPRVPACGADPSCDIILPIATRPSRGAAPDFPYFGGWRRIAPRRICQGVQFSAICGSKRRRNSEMLPTGLPGIHPPGPSSVKGGCGRRPSHGRPTFRPAVRARAFETLAGNEVQRGPRAR